jgi:hypothetical protein
MGFGKAIQKAVEMGIISPVKTSTSVPMSVDVSSEGMKKKTLARGTNVSYSGIRTTSKGLLTDAKIEKKTLLGM